MAKTTVVAQGRFTADQIAGCDGGQSDDLSGYYLLRLNGYCREDVCGSVLLGWYVVDQETGDVFEWDMGALSRGQEVTNPN